jgi:hypothetical protein
LTGCNGANSVIIKIKCSSNVIKNKWAKYINIY